MKIRKAQVGIEYLLIMGFAVAVIIGMLGVAFYYSGSVNDQIKFSQIDSCARKIISASESVFYSGTPSKATLSCYLPDNVRQIEILENNLIFTFQTSSGISKTSFSSKVPISGNLPSFFGLKSITVRAEQNFTVISS